ncbi:hypothetical protein OIU83_21605 [Flavobacterium sp. LS1R49]|uniref:DUF4280 domain-containing protein n=1 Tax=Flavobacterium shii TaxID=2987687 RepID=A0A9X3C5F9_9FLAO|nr:hypothetical protein [Flavobacterium shii]MCV9930269.1 hypothetical protein [Flavobacterium shii]
MSVSYIPKNVYVICNFQKDAGPRQLIPTRETITVFYGTDKERPLLTIDDRNINKEFPCKSPTNAMWSFLCFGAGLIIGAALILSGPIGWAVLAIGVGAMAYGLYQSTKIDHMCSGALGKGKWWIEHDTVKFDKKKAITQNSLLLCDIGGLLTPIFSYAIAKKYAKQINNNNDKEIALNAVMSLVGGAGFVVAGLEMGVAKTLLWTGGTMAAMNVATYGEREIIRNNSLEDNKHYQDLNNKVDENSLIPSYIKDPLAATPSDISSPDILELDKNGNLTSRDGKTPIFLNGKWYVQDWQQNITEIKQGTELSKDLSVLEGIDSREVWKTPEGKVIVENIRKGKYSESLIQTTKDGSGTVRPRNLPILAEELPNVKVQNLKNIGKLGIKGGGAIAFIFPFITTYFSEESRKFLAEAMEEDMDNGISIMSRN